MTESTSQKSQDNTQATPPPSGTLFQKFSFLAQFVAAMAVGLLVLAYLIFWPGEEHADIRGGATRPAQAVTVVDYKGISIDPGSSLANKLAYQRVQSTQTSSPLLRVTGSVVASLRPIGDDDSDTWQFADPDVLSTFLDWEIAQLDIEFFTQQIEMIEELTQVQIDAQRRVVERMERLVGAGTDTVAELELARAELMEREISARQDLREAQVELLRAKRNESTLLRQLELIGLDPVVLKEEVTSDVDLVMADVPEEFKERVRVGQQCEARFVGMRNVVFPGTVRSIGGEPVGQLFEEDRVFNIVARLDEESRRSPRAIGELFVYNEDDVPVPLSQIARIEVVDGQTIIARQDGRRRLTVRCDIVDRDQGGFVAEARRRFNDEITLPPGYNVMWLGMFENLERAYNHFMALIPLTIALIFATLLVIFGSLRAAIVLMMPVPFAVASGALALLLRDMYLNVSTGVGFATLFGIAMMDAVLMYKAVTGYRLEGMELDEAIVKGRCDILRRGLMTSLVAILGLLPASLATGLGSDVQRPLANVIVWGLTGSTLFSLFISPVVYRIILPPAKKI